MYAAPGSLSVEVKVDATSPDRIIYLLRLGTDSPEPVAMDIYILPGGGYAGASSGTKISSLAIGREHGQIVPVVVTPSEGSERALVTRIVWKHDNRIYSELVFLPSRFDAKASGKTSSIGFQGTTAHDILGAISAQYGVVILAPGNLARRTVSAAVERGTPDTGRAGLLWRGLAPSIYVVEPLR